MEKKINLKIFSSKKNIEIQSLCYGLNLFLPTLILILSSIFKNYTLAAELGILIGINIIFTQIFSANLRSIIISKNSTDNLYSYIIFRSIIALIVVIVNLIIFYVYQFVYQNILIQITLLILIQWQSEIILTYYEIKNKIKKFFEYLFICLLFSILITVCLVFNYNFLNILIFFNILFFLYFIVGILKLKKKLYSINKIFSKIIISPAFFSSFAISLSNLIWRIMILNFCGKIVAGIYFASFAIGSLPGTLFNNSFGPTMLKGNLKIKYFDFFKFISYFIIALLVFFSFYNKEKIFVDNQFTQLFVINVSLIGSIFMIKGLYYRQFLIQKTNFKSKLFIYDIFYSIIICSVVPSLFVIGGINFIALSFLISSLVSFAMYKLIYINLVKKK